MIRRSIAFGLIAVTLIAALLYSQRRSGPLIVSGFLEADEIRMGSRVGGRVARVLVDEGQAVAAGDLLLELEPFDLKQRRAEAEATWQQRTAAYERLKAGYRDEEIAQAKARNDQAQANLLMLQNGPRQQEIEAARAELDREIAELDLAEENYARISKLSEQGVATQEAMDRATKERRAATQRVTARREQLELLQEGTRSEELAMASARVDESEQAWQLMKDGYRKEEIAEARSAAQAAQSALAAMDKQLEELQVRTPTTGSIEAVELRPGDLVSANAPVISMIDHTRLWVRAYVPENHLDIALGQQFPITVDSFPGESFVGEVTFISQQAEFTPRNIQTPEERSKQVFRIKVMLVEGRERLRPGMAADVWLEGQP